MSAEKPAQGRQDSTIPIEIRNVKQWVAWWGVIGEDRPVRLPNGKHTDSLKAQAKPHKLPIAPRSGDLAATNRAGTWCSFQEALNAAERWSLTGIGFVFTDSDPYAGIDFDNCRDPDSGLIADWALEVIRRMNSYTEVSPSGTGVHIIVRGSLPAGRGNQKALNGGKVEMFSRLRYFTFTGIHVDGTPADICDRGEELLALQTEHFGHRTTGSPCSHSGPQPECTTRDAELIHNALHARNGAKFERLWKGVWKGDYPSQSEADLAFCGLLAFWTEGNGPKIDSLFRQSGLMRDKWNGQSYRERTIQLALDGSHGSYQKRRRSSSGSGPRAAEQEGDAPQVPDLLSFPHTDTGNAERLLLLHGSKLRFCIEMKKWLLWDSRRWSIADSRRVKQLFTKTIRAMYEQTAGISDKDQREAAEKHARRSESANLIAATLLCAECEDGVCVNAGELDSHAYLLNCLNGTLDLQTGVLRAHDREDLITQLVHVSYRADATCPKFLQFIHRIMGQIPGASPTARAGALIAYLQRCFGYSLTADVSEKVVFCFFGSGNNGKTTLLEIVRFILSEYSTQVLVDTLMAHKSRDSSASLADLADLRGARFVTTSEPEEGQRLAVAKLKYLTQGSGEVKTCRKYENPITFLATHKLYLDANHRPVVRGSDKAIWNRLKPVPFETTIPLEEIDRQLPGKLKEEAEGILAWMVEGCLAWMRDGLGEPPEVSEAATSWENESDHFLTFWNERYTRQPSGWVAVAEIWANYTVWCDSRPEESRLAKTQFDMRLRGMGFQEARRNSGTVRAWVGLEARNLEDSDGDKVTPGDTKC